MIPHAGPIGTLVVAVIEASFRAAAMALAGGEDRGPTGGGTAGRRAIGVGAITRGADREETVAATTDLLAKRRVHEIDAAARFDWTRRENRGTRDRTARSVGASRRSLEGLELLPPGPHLAHRRLDSLQQSTHFGGGARRQLLPGVGVIATAAERLQGSSTIAAIRTDSE